MGFNVLLAKFLRSLYQGSGLRVYVADTIPHGSSLGFKVECRILSLMLFCRAPCGGLGFRTYSFQDNVDIEVYRNALF